MADVTLTYKGATIAELSDSGSKTLRTAGKYCEADIGVEYVKPSGGGVTPTGTKEITITTNGTTTEDVANYAAAQITVNVPSGGGDDTLFKKITDQTVERYFADCAGSRVTTRAFDNWTRLKNVFLKDAGLVGAYAFNTNNSLETATIIAATIDTFSQGNVFSAGCTSLHTVYFSTELRGNIGILYFNGASSLTKFIIKSPAVVALNNINVFNGTPFASGKAGGTLYVPQALIADYQAATNWSTILGYANNRILPIEGSIYETQYADGTPIPTT